MNRKRRHAKVDEPPPLSTFCEFRRVLPELADGSERMATDLDLYCVYTHLHAAGRSSELRGGRRFHYYLISKADETGDNQDEDDGIKEVMIPMNTGFEGVSLGLLRSLFTEPEGTPPSNIHLALVDADGSITTYKMYNHIEPPGETDPPKNNKRQATEG